MHIQVVNFKLQGLSHEQYMKACKEQFAPAFRDMPGLISKVWLSNPETNTYGGVYTWRDKAAADAYLASDLFRSIQNHPNLTEVTSTNFGVLDGIVTGPTHPDPFGFAAVSQDLTAARQFYERLYPYKAIEGIFAGIKYISIMKDGVTLVNVFEKSAANPIHGTIPILKVDSVKQSLEALEALGGSVVIPETTCPCTDTSFAVCADPGGNQFMFKEATN